MIVSKFEAELEYYSPGVQTKGKMAAIHRKTMKLIELDDLSLQMKLSLEDKEALISVSTKLKAQAENECGLLGMLS